MSRRRSHSDDDEGGARKRRRTSEPMDIEDRLESLITRVGEKSTSSLESNLEGLAGVLEADLPNYKNKILRILCDCVLKMPEKTTVYTTLVGLLNAKNYNCGGEFMELMVRNLKEALKVCRFDDARVMIRFLADLVNCHVIAAPSLMSMFDNFVEVTLEDNIPQARSDWYVNAVLGSLPWVGRELYEKKEAEFDRMLSAIDSYISKRLKVHLPALQVWSSEVPHPQEEYLDCLWAQIKKLRSDKWQEKQILRPYLAFDGVLCEALQHNLPQILLPPHNEDSMYPFPYVIFRLFDYTDCPEGPILPGSHTIERYLIEENLHRILNQFHRERKECAAQLLSVPDKNLIPLNYMIVEVIFAQLFNLPLNPFLEIFYGSLIIELCKLQPSSMPQVLAQAAEMLYERIDTMNTTSIDRFVNWFSYHLSNFQYRWSWEDWATCQNLDPEHPKAKFVAEVLNKCMRLSYYQRVAEIMPENFGALIPERNQCLYKYNAENAESLPGKLIADQLTSAIKGKCTSDEVITLLKDVPNPLQDDEGEPSHNPLKIDIFLNVLLHLGSKSISHSFAAIAKFHYVFKTFAETEEAQICVLRSLFEIWRKHQQMMIILVDKMLKTQIVECSSVANWLFSTEMNPEFTKSYIWEIMNVTINMMNKHVFKLQMEVEENRDKLDSSREDNDMDTDAKDEKESPTEEMLERMEERLEYAQSEQKNLFLIIFQRFIIILTEHLVRCESEGVDYNNFWYRWAVGRLQQIFLTHHDQVYKYSHTLETLLFTSDIDIHILEIFQQFSALRS